MCKQGPTVEECCCLASRITNITFISTRCITPAPQSLQSLSLGLSPILYHKTQVLSKGRSNLSFCGDPIWHALCNLSRSHSVDPHPADFCFMWRCMSSHFAVLRSEPVIIYMGLVLLSDVVWHVGFSFVWGGGQ